MVSKNLLIFILALFFYGQVQAQTPPEVMAQFQGKTPEATFTDDDGVQRFVVSCVDSFYSVWWIYPDSLPDSAASCLSGAADSLIWTVRAFTDTFDVCDNVVGIWTEPTIYHAGFVAFRWDPVDWDVDRMVFGTPRLFRVEVSKPPPPQSPQIQFQGDP